MKNRKPPIVWIVEYQASDGSWWPIMPYNLFQFRYQAKAVEAIFKREEFGKYRTSKYLRGGRDA